VELEARGAGALRYVVAVDRDGHVVVLAIEAQHPAHPRCIVRGANDRRRPRSPARSDHVRQRPPVHQLVGRGLVSGRDPPGARERSRPTDTIPLGEADTADTRSVALGERTHCAHETSVDSKVRDDRVARVGAAIHAPRVTRTRIRFPFFVCSGRIGRRSRLGAFPRIPRMPVWRARTHCRIFLASAPLSIQTQ
jgi:hypothetical protein